MAILRPSASGQELKFGAEVARPESGPQHIDVVYGRRSHDRPGAPHAQLSPGGGIHVIAHTNKLREGHGSRNCGCRQIVKIAKARPHQLPCAQDRINMVSSVNRP